MTIKLGWAGERCSMYVWDKKRKEEKASLNNALKASWNNVLLVRDKEYIPTLLDGQTHIACDHTGLVLECTSRCIRIYE